MNQLKNSWATNSIFYHIYPLGLCGTPLTNNFAAASVSSIKKIESWISHISDLGCNAVYLGPVFESSTHGYDTADYFTVDHRLGTNEDLEQVVDKFHGRGLRVILDGVFHHVGRDFWAFKDLQEKGSDSAYKDWFSGVKFQERSSFGDNFSYNGWNGHYNLVKLNLQHPEVRSHLFAAVKMWMEEFNIDGLRLDAADVMDKHFLSDLANYCRELRADFCLIGEVIHGDYNHWVNSGMLDSVTNYECYKGLYSSHNDVNYFEIAYSLNRQFGENGVYKNLSLYTFADNHDVNRVASTLHHTPHLYPLYALLLTMPGIPSIYYGSEWGIEGMKQNGDDQPLRPSLELLEMQKSSPHPDLARAIQQFAQIRVQRQALRFGNYQQLMVTHQQFAFSRQTDQDYVIVIVNAANTSAKINLNISSNSRQHLTDLLNPDESFTVKNGKLWVEVPPCWARILG